LDVQLSSASVQQIQGDPGEPPSFSKREAEYGVTFLSVRLTACFMRIATALKE